MVNSIFIKSFVILIFTSVAVQAQQEGKMLIRSLISEDSTTITSIAIYPQATRDNMMILCKKPDVILQITNLQKKTSVEFKNLISGLNRKQQERLWSLCRYPALISHLSGPAKTYEQLDKISADYPEEIKNDIFDFGMCYNDLLTDIEILNDENAEALNRVTQKYPDLQEALNKLLRYPETIDLLSRNIRTATMLGNLHSSYPLLLNQTFDSISTAYASFHAQELQAWKAGFDKNPEAKAEMESATTEFNNYIGYDEYMDTYDDDMYIRYETVYVEVDYQPYSWWFGYPWWYQYPCWYPYPWWYHCGYYCGPYGPVFIGMPSPFYMHWYLHRSQNHYHYSHFSTYCIQHYYGHRGIASAFNRELEGWIHTNELKVPTHFFANNKGLPERIREFGKFEIEFSNAKQRQPISRDEFLKINAGKYPNIQGKTGSNDTKPKTPSWENKVPATPSKNPTPTQNKFPSKHPQNSKPNTTKPQPANKPATPGNKKLPQKNPAPKPAPKKHNL